MTREEKNDGEDGCPCNILKWKGEYLGGERWKVQLEKRREGGGEGSAKEVQKKRSVYEMPSTFDTKLADLENSGTS